METKKESYKSTILTISMGFLALYLIFNWKWAVIIALLIGLIGIFSPFLSRKIEWFWMKISKILALVFPKILLTLVYFLFLVPVAALYKLFNKDPLKLNKNYNSYFLKIERSFDKNNLNKTW